MIDQKQEACRLINLELNASRRVDNSYSFKNYTKHQPKVSSHTNDFNKTVDGSSFFEERSKL